MKSVCILLLIGLGFHRNPSIDEGIQLDRADEVCDTITTKEFLSLSKQIYNKLPSIGRASDDEKRKAIKICNTILLVNSTCINSKAYIRNFQLRLALLHEKRINGLMLRQQIDAQVAGSNSSLY